MALIGTRAAERRSRGLLARIDTLIAGLWTEWKARKAAYHLMGLDDAHLRDIGLSRADIHLAVRGRRNGRVWGD